MSRTVCCPISKVRTWRLARGIAAAICVTVLAACGGSSGGSTPITYTVGVNVSGLSGSGLVLQLNMGSSLAITADGNATFAAAVASGTSYNVIVKTQPTLPLQTCTVTNGSGTIGAANVTSVNIACVTDPSATMLYFPLEAEGDYSMLLGYPANVSGPVSPTAIFKFQFTLGDVDLGGMTTDSLGDIYTSTTTLTPGNNFSGQVQVFAPPVSSTVSFPPFAFALRTITITPLAFYPGSIAVDGAGNIYVCTSSPFIAGQNSSYAILEFAAGASDPVSPAGYAEPIRTIDLAAGCRDLAVDGNGNIAYLANQPESNEILLFTSGQSGNATPARTISLGANLQIIDFSLDPGGNIYVATYAADGSVSSVLMFQGGADGADTGTPVAGIVDGVPAGTEISSLRFDAAGNLYLFGPAASFQLTQDQSVTRFTPAADGFTSPTSEILMTPSHSVEAFIVGFSVH
jgi:hypothetical protein